MPHRTHQSLPFTAHSQGRILDIDFPLHALTGDAGNVGAMLEDIMAALTQRIEADGSDVSDGDVLQALTMALAIRMHMVKAPPAAVRQLVAEALEWADDAVEEAGQRPVGRA